MRSEDVPMSPTTAPERASEQEPKVEVLLAPRVIDERAYRSLGERLRELVERAEKTEGALGSATGRGGDLLSSLEAMAHTQTRRAREIRESIDAMERRVGALDPSVVEARMVEISRTGDEAVKRALAARAALEESVVEARRRVEEINSFEPTTTLGLDPAEAKSLAEALATHTERAENAARKVRETAAELEGLKDQTNALLTAMRATILECADARDRAESRLDRLTSATRKAEAALESVEARASAAEDRAGRLDVAELDLDPIVREVSRRVMAAVGARVETELGRLAAAPAEQAADTAAGADEALAEIRRSIELASETSEAMRVAARPAAEEIPSACERVDEERRRRLASPPFGASGELGDPARTKTVWRWTGDDFVS